MADLWRRFCARHYRAIIATYVVVALTVTLILQVAQST